MRLSSQLEETFWTLWQVLNWIICRKPENLLPWYFNAIEQVKAGISDRELSEEPVLGIRNPETEEVTDYYVAKRTPLDDLVDDAIEALTNKLKKGSLKAIGGRRETGEYEEINGLAWWTLILTDKQGARSRSGEFEDIRFLADEIKRGWPETSNGLLALELSGKESNHSQAEGSTNAARHDQQENKSQRKADAEQDAHPRSVSFKDRALKDEIEKVRRLARQQWPKAKERPEVRRMARELLDKSGKEIPFKFETVRKILDGAYSPSQRLNIVGL